ncbi:hypothetical protein AVEN_64591-1 [Araneus ventricosus]|uniref:EGF-like domain-containing protein n=1 Tax=Araneus ventricosus TaxID=182803 RepID=A0A4Y2RLA6_ARAVE|nr:hypothetical protein AVEN_64591-1 [Araneus ventricosus]
MQPHVSTLILDAISQLAHINECETDNTCHPSATCRNTFGSFECECPDGYTGHNGRIVEPGEVCEDINECQESPSACWFYDHVKCVNLPGSYKCECLQGYEPTSYSNDPHRTTCVRTTKHWGPSVIVLCTTLALMAVSGLMHIHVKKRAARSN